MEPKRGAIAVCGIGTLGLITSRYKEFVTYPDGNTGKAWTGIHLTDKVCPQFSPWSSTRPIVLGYLQMDELEDFDKIEKALQKFVGEPSA